MLEGTRSSRPHIFRRFLYKKSAGGTPAFLLILVFRSYLYTIIPIYPFRADSIEPFRAGLTEP
ncbi:MAG: hypothetical protein LBE18_01195 [Planctomycetaceae bacterium]|nr:hypothetical protein [Planctomycetaceae bacterium]